MPTNPKPNYSRCTTPLILSGHMEDLENQKTGGSRELFLPENDFKTCSTVNSKKNRDLFLFEVHIQQR